MKVKKLIEKLQKLPENAKVEIIYDGEPRMSVDLVFESVSGKIIIMGYNEPIYTEKYYPKGIVNDSDKTLYTRKSWKKM
jgi:hypothetical protein